MKAVFISYNQAYDEEITLLLEVLGQRGFTRWADVQGRGSESGIPHFDSHAWPELNMAVLSVMEEEKVAPLLAALKEKDLESPDLGLRAFVWNIENLY